MKFALASYGSRGDIEPCAAVGRELQRRGHDVSMAVPPDLVVFVESAGLHAVPYGLDTRAWLEVHRDLWTRIFRSFWNVQDLVRLVREVREPIAECWEKISTPLMSLADGADLLFTGLSFEQPAANVAEYYDIPLATLHYHPARANGQLMPFVPAPVGRFAITVDEWVGWLISKKLDDAQRLELGLPKATGPASGRIAGRGSLEVQAYDEPCFPGLAAEWAKWDGQRPFVGALTLELATESDEDVEKWIASGSPPIFFGFGSIPVDSPADLVVMIAGVCAQLGERALIGAGWSDFSDVPSFEHVKVVGTVNFAAIFSSCRAVVHHGAAGTTAAGLRAGVPALILWTLPDQSFWGVRLTRLGLGKARRFSGITRESLVEDLSAVLAPDVVARAAAFATRMTTPAQSVRSAADHVENFARLGRVG
ncbi:glycosyltransferase [Mycolicibacterium novocastrense]|uniref:Glycosyl transferase, UDP-glucuronosyltransferase n=1 Tax=Mycolicibacterium novocastrense TaxID=59813 RepID=A0AAW5SKT0_MYCNV|nr:glycosyltransferase [Mycolicibacterium novocastrense]MCV7023722.1 glycosyltransferase [Mycolicibacterium novocastrense]GAT11597.1 glycosyl transferase, UDP-glucuronosyltransferase [Mycolicibacterium novocastrense]